MFLDPQHWLQLIDQLGEITGKVSEQSQRIFFCYSHTLEEGKASRPLFIIFGNSIIMFCTMKSRIKKIIWILFNPWLIYLLGCKEEMEVYRHLYKDPHERKTVLMLFMWHIILYVSLP